MTNKNLTLVAVLVDRSGSMSSCRDDMEGGLNTFIEEQRNQPGQLDFALAQFDTEFEVVRQMGRLTSEYTFDLVPRGGTALYDAIGNYITVIGEQLRAKKESARPGKVIMVIVTDGGENSSKEYRGMDGQSRVKALVEQQRGQWSWEFVFLGANIDAVATAGFLGIPRTSSMTYATANAGDMYGATSNLVSSIRVAPAGASVQFTEDDRKNAVKSK